MKKWHEGWVGNLGLRAGGLGLLAIAWLAAQKLHSIAQVIPARDATPQMLLLSAILFLCASAGSALMWVGPGLWEVGEVSERWRRVAAPDAATRRLDE